LGLGLVLDDWEETELVLGPEVEDWFVVVLLCAGAEPNQTNSAPAWGFVGAVSGLRGRPTSFLRRDVVQCAASLMQREHAAPGALLWKMHFSLRAWHLSHARRGFTMVGDVDR
jgi:hypothetical protein